MPWAVLTKGVAMGIAEVVPGVSGGTIAFVTGIYDELMRSLVGVSGAMRSILRWRWREAWITANGDFLLPLVVGMATGALLFAQLFAVLIDRYPALVRGFFLGVIVMSGLIVARTAWRGLGADGSKVVLIGIALLGLLVGWGLAVITRSEGSDPSLLLVALGGFIAVSAWMIPGVSGSLLLLLLGVYPTVLDAVAGFEWRILVPLVAGMLAGLIVAPRIFVHLLDRFRAPFLMFLAAVMLASTRALNPWDGVSETPLVGIVAVLGVGAGLVYWSARRAAS